MPGRTPLDLPISSLIRHERYGLVLRKCARPQQDSKWRALEAESSALRRLQALAYRPGLAASLPLWLAEQRSPQELALLRQFLPGRSLSQLLAEGPLGAVRLARWMKALFGLLADIHEQQLCHGDLSPHNLLITPAGELVLLDWGLADRLTPAFAPPEGSCGLHPATDVYALARVWLRCLSETFRLESVPEAQQRSLIAACLKSDPESRPSAREVFQALNLEPRLFPTCLGRQQQLSDVDQLIREEAPRRAVWVAMPAPSGVGKSEFLKDVASRYLPCLWGQGSTLRSPSSFTVFQELARALRAFGFPVELSDPLSWELLRQVFPALSGDQKPPEVPFGPLGAGALARGWAELLERSSQKLGHLLVIVDDAQWIDESSRQLLAALFKELRAGVTVLVSWRADQWNPPEEIEWTARLELGPLPASEVKQWAERGGLPLNALELAELHRWSGGLPLLLRYWMDDPQRSLQYSRVAVLLEERTSQLESKHEQVLQTAALLGKNFQLEPIYHLHPEAARAALARAEELQILLPSREQSQSFSHDRLRELCLARCPEPDRRERHARLAEFYLARQPEALSEAVHHLHWSGRDDQAAPLALVAARHEKGRLALHSARQFYEIHMQRPHLPDIWLEYCEVLNGLNSTHQARQHLQDLRATRLDPRLRARVVEMICELSFQLMDLETMQAVATQERWKDGVRSLGLWLYYSFVHAFHCSNRPRLAGLVPLAALYCKRYPTANPLLSATMISGFDQLGWSQQAHSLRQTVANCVSRHDHPQLWAPVLSRLNAYRFGDPCLDVHLKLLRELELEHERVGNAFDLAMVLMQIGYYAICRGDIEELYSLSRRLHNMGKQMQNDDFVQVALHLQTEARGGRTAWKPLAEHLQRPARHFLGHAHLVVAAAQVKLRRGQPEQAWRYLNLHPRYGATYDNAMVFTWRASVARQLLEKTPRWQAQLRQYYLQQGLHWVKQALSCSQQMKSYLAHALREQAWLSLAQGQMQAAQELFARSSEQARQFGSTLQEGLSRRDWGEAGRDCGWPEADQQYELGRALLQRLGAWWELDLGPHTELLEDLGEAITAFLVQPDEERRGALQELADPALSLALEELAEAQSEAQARLVAENQHLQEENLRWQGFIQAGLVRGGAEGALELPPQRASYLQLQKLVQLENELLRGQLESDLGRWPAALVLEWRNLGGQPSEAWGPAQQIPWERLDILSTHVLRCVLREIRSNSQRHGQGPMRWHLDCDTRYLTLSFHQERKPGPAGDGFGTDGMRFRLAQIGAEISVRIDPESYHLTMRLSANASEQMKGIKVYSSISGLA